MKPFIKTRFFSFFTLSVAILYASILVFSLILGSTSTGIPSESQNDRITSLSDRSYNFLLLGKDKAADLCDVIIIVSYDTKTHKIEALQIPRDTYASYTGASYRKLNGAHHSLGSIDKLVEFIERTLCIPIDYYLVTDMDTISDTVNKLGGIEVSIESDMHYSDPYQDLSIDMKAGKHTLDGEEAVKFLRYRAGYLRGDLGRLDAQKIFLASLVNKILTESSIHDIASIALGLIDTLETNISISDCMYFISEIGKIKLENIALMTMPGEDIQSQSGAWYYIINREEAYNIIKKYFSPSISEADFDKDRLFTSMYRYGFNRIYDAKNTYKTERYTADEICRDGISID